MAKIRLEDLMRHFAGDMVPVVAAAGENRRQKANDEAERARQATADRREELRLRLSQEQNQATAKRAADDDKRQDRAAERAERSSRYELENPWVYNGMRFPTEAERNRVRDADLQASASTTARYRAPRATSTNARGETASQAYTRSLNSARGDLRRWYSRRADLSPDAAERYVRELYPDLSAGEVSSLVEEVRVEYDRTRNTSRTPR